MKNNVISIDNCERFIEPNDLMTFKELELKYGFKYGYLYKWACLSKDPNNRLTLYSRGTLRLSEQEVLDFERKKRINKYGGN